MEFHGINRLGINYNRNDSNKDKFIMKMINDNKKDKIDDDKTRNFNRLNRLEKKKNMKIHGTNQSGNRYTRLSDDHYHYDNRNNSIYCNKDCKLIMKTKKRKINNNNKNFNRLNRLEKKKKMEIHRINRSGN